MKILSTAVLATMFLSACASPTPTPSKPGPTEQLTSAATAPLSDLNLVRADIPVVLQAALKAPYGAPPDKTCAGLATDIQVLDIALGADLDTPPTASNPGLVARGGTAVGDAAIGAVRGAAEGVVPFRGWIRKLSGAERYSREVSAAIAAGTIRRAYLKGIGQASGCTVPAAPRV